MIGQTVALSTGDVGFVPAGVSFQYWITVAFTEFYLGASGSALGDALVKESKEWDYAVFPSYVG
jgi:hypothetical protein